MVKQQRLNIGKDMMQAERVTKAKSVIRVGPKRASKKKAKMKFMKLKITPKAKPKVKCVGTPIAKRWKKEKEEESVITLSTENFLRDNLLKLDKEERELQEMVNKKTINVELPTTLYTDCCMKEEDCKIQFSFDDVSPSLEMADMEYIDTMMNGAFKNELDLYATYDAMRHRENTACLRELLDETASMDSKDAVKLLFDTASFVTDDLFNFDFDCEL